MSSFVGRWCELLCLLCCCCCWLIAQQGAVADDETPYEFSFNIVDFQHRFEKKDAEGIINGEYGFITADGVYHETGYATDKNGDFIITRMRNRKITSLKDAQEIFKDRPEAAKKLVEAIAKACGDCKISIKEDDDRKKPAKLVTEPPPFPKKKPLPETARRVDAPARSSPEQQSNPVPRMQLKQNDAAKDTARVAKRLENERVLEKMANDLYYRFNYTITTHGHHEDGYRDGRKDGSYQSQSDDGIETRVKYLSNEFGHQPNITFVPRANTDEKHALKGYTFRWYWSK